MPFYHLLTDVVLVSSRTGTGVDVYGTPTFGEWRRVSAAVQESFQKIRDSEGNERVTSHSIATSERLSVGDRVILPTENGVPPSFPPSDDDVKRARTPVAIRNDRSRRSGFRFYQTFF